ncbi:MAG: DUF2807 domain-containing protein [Chitinophagaceae bacterium]|nr:MAG: DUF2807 domain-containing protein [Chitinophagaceae bacterium]
MKKTAIVLIAFLCQLALQAQDVVLDANVMPRSISGSFDNIRLSGNIKLVLSQGNDVSLAVSASQEKYADEIKTEIENNTLRIFTAADNWVRKKEYTVYLGFKQIAALAASGAGSIKVVGPLVLKDFKVDLSGASNIHGTLNVESLTIALSGASAAKLSGTAKHLNINSSGASDVNAFGLQSMFCSANAAGASDLRVNATQELNAVASGASHIYYKGDAEKVNIKNSGVSKVLRQ